MTQDTTDDVRCLVSDPDLGDGEHWVIEALDEIDAAELGERIIAWARENQGGSVTLRSKVFERARYDALGEKAGV